MRTRSRRAAATERRSSRGLLPAFRTPSPARHNGMRSNDPQYMQQEPVSSGMRSSRSPASNTPESPATLRSAKGIQHVIVDMSPIQNRTGVTDGKYQDPNISSNRSDDNAILSPRREEGMGKLEETKIQTRQLSHGPDINRNHPTYPFSALEAFGVDNEDIAKSNTPTAKFGLLFEPTQASPTDQLHLQTDEQLAARIPQQQDEDTYLHAFSTDNGNVNLPDIENHKEEHGLIRSSISNTISRNTGSSNSTPPIPGQNEKDGLSRYKNEDSNKENFPFYTLPPSPPPPFPPQVAPTPQGRHPLQEIRVDRNGTVHRDYMFPRAHRAPNVRRSVRLNQNNRRDNHTLPRSTTQATVPVQISSAFDTASNLSPREQNSSELTAFFNVEAMENLLENVAACSGKRSYDDFVERIMREDTKNEEHSDTLIVKKRKMVNDNLTAAGSLMDMEYGNHETTASSTVPRSNKAQKRNIFSPRTTRYGPANLKPQHEIAMAPPLAPATPIPTKSAGHSDLNILTFGIASPGLGQYPPDYPVTGFGDNNFQHAPWLPPIQQNYLASNNTTISQPQEALFCPDQDHSSLDGSTLIDVDILSNHTPFKIHDDMEWLEQAHSLAPNVRMDFLAGASLPLSQNENVRPDDEVTTEEMKELDEEYNALQNQLASIKNSRWFLRQALRDSVMHRQAIKNEKVRLNNLRTEVRSIASSLGNKAKTAATAAMEEQYHLYTQLQGIRTWSENYKAMKLEMEAEMDDTEL